MRSKAKVSMPALPHVLRVTPEAREHVSATANGLPVRDSGIGCPVHLAMSRGGSERRPGGGMLSWRRTVSARAAHTLPPQSRRSPNVEPMRRGFDLAHLEFAGRPVAFAGRVSARRWSGANAPGRGRPAARPVGTLPGIGGDGTGRRAHTPHAPPAATEVDSRRARGVYFRSRAYAAGAENSQIPDVLKDLW